MSQVSGRMVENMGQISKVRKVQFFAGRQKFDTDFEDSIILFCLDFIQTALSALKN